MLSGKESSCLVDIALCAHLIFGAKWSVVFGRSQNRILTSKLFIEVANISFASLHTHKTTIRQKSLIFLPTHQCRFEWRCELFSVQSLPIYALYDEKVTVLHDKTEQTNPCSQTYPEERLLSNVLGVTLTSTQPLLWTAAEKL